MKKEEKHFFNFNKGSRVTSGSGDGDGRREEDLAWAFFGLQSLYAKNVFVHVGT